MALFNAGDLGMCNNHMTQPDDHLNACNTLMLSHVYRPLPTARHHAWACSAGSKGYCATKEMLQNGIPGHTLLIESKDLRDVGIDGGKGDECCVIYNFPRHARTTFNYSDHIPTTTKHVVVYTSSTSLPSSLLESTTVTSVDLSPLSHVTTILASFLRGCTGLKSLDLRPLSTVTRVHEAFLRGCTGLTTVDLSPLSNLKEVHRWFLADCTALTTLDLRPLSKVTKVQMRFLSECSGLTALDLAPLSQLKEIQMRFLSDCTGLIALDLSPLSQVTEIHAGFLCGCSGLQSLDMGPLSQVAVVQGEFLSRCTGLRSVDNPPPLIAQPPSGWVHTTGATNQWVVQEESIDNTQTIE